MFTETLGYIGDTITCEVDGFTLTATLYRDDSGDAPWENDDGVGEVSDWRDASSKAPGERVLYQDRQRCRFYDFAGTVARARAEGWGEKRDGETAGQRAVAAVEADFKRLRDWCNDDWRYVGVAVTVSRADVQLTGPYDHAVWGIESDAGDYLRDTANDLAADALDAAKAKLAELAA